jgi:preprotein translocase subunit YajC
MLFTIALLQETAQAGGPNPIMTNIFLFGGMILLFYFLLIRPQSKARKALEEKLSKLKPGDEVILTSGFYATVERVDDVFIYLKLGNTVVKARRNAVATLANEQERPGAPANKNPSVIR